MLKEDEHIIFVIEAQIIALVKKDDMREVKNSGFTNKKVIVTTQRLLIFQSLSNRLQQTEYELTTTMAKKPLKNPQMERKSRISVNGFPQMSFDIMGFQSKVVIEEEPTFFKFLQKQGIQNLVKSVIGTVLLKMPKKMKYYILSMGGISNAIRFSKAVICGQSWKKYTSYCRQIKSQTNVLWVRILTEIIHNEDSVVLVDPDLFLTGSRDQIQTFIFLITIIPFAHCFHHRYSITTQQSATYAADFIISIEGKIHSLSFKNTHLTTSTFKIVLMKAALGNLIKLDISENSLEDDVFQILNKLMKAGARRLSYINLSKNKIKLSNPQLLVQVLKVTATILNLNLSHNFIDDSSTQTFQKYVIFAFNPPLQEFDVSHNKFSRKIAWRLYAGNLRNFKNHPYLKFLLYPIPIKKEIFGDFNIEFPKHNTTINLNMHSALVQQFQQESILKNTFYDTPLTSKQAITIKFQRVLANNVKLPMNRQQLNRTLQISHTVQNFIYAPQAVENIYNLALEVKRFPFEIPPISRQHFVRYLYQKFNEALFIRDHYSVKYLLMALNELGVSIEGYTERLNILKQRNNVFTKRSQNLLNFQIDESKINEELDELVRQGLRLYLEGHGIEMLYYLKYRRDQYIEKYLNEKLNPEHYLFDLMAKKNISAEQKISEKEFVIPYQIRLQKKINQNFYLHPWQANYQILSEMQPATFNSCLQFLEQSEKKQKFAVYFDRIQERIEFIKNEFTYFSYNKFKASYSDLKINACRLSYLYNNIKETSIYLEMPLYVKKRLVTPQKNVVILNKQWYKREYHVVNYPNINIKARRANFYNYMGTICRYQSEIFYNESSKMLRILNDFFYTIEVAVSTRAPVQSKMPRLIELIKSLIDFIRHSLVPQELKEQFYLHIISWRKGRFNNNTELLQFIPAFTMYLKPPLQIQKYLVAAILQNDYLDIQQLPLCLASNPNQPTPDNVIFLENQFVERDWLPNDKYFCQLFEKKGRVTLQIQLLEKTKIVISVAESKTVAELMDLLIDCVEMTCEDREHFWIYKFWKQNQQIIPYESRQHVGEILADFDPKQNMLLLKRRIYSRQLKFNFNKYGQKMINSLYNDIKYEYMCRNFFINDKVASEVAANLFIIEGVQNTLNEITNNRSRYNQNTTDQTSIEKIMVQKMAQLDSSFIGFVPKKIYSRLMKSKDGFVSEMKSKISEKFLKKQHNNIFQMKLNLLRVFSKFPEFMSSNHRLRSKQKGQMRISVNAIYIYIEYESQCEYINLQKLVTIVPKVKYLMIYYHKQQNLVAQLPMFGQQKAIFALAFDLLSYSSMRIKMSSINLYQIYHMEDLQKKIQTMEVSLKRVYDKTVEKTLMKSRDEFQAGNRKIVKMSLTLMNLKQLQYYKKNNYIKSEMNRKLYANKTDKKLDFQTELDQEQANQIVAANKRILHTIFPQFMVNVKEDEEIEDHKMSQKKFTNDPNDSLDFKKEYEKLNFETTNKVEEPYKPQPQQPLSNSYQPPPPSPPPPPSKPAEQNPNKPPAPSQFPPSSPPKPVEQNSYKPPPPPPEPPVEEDDPEDVVTATKPRGRVPRRRNR